MTVPGNIDALLLGGQRGYQIERSLRFNSADSAYLNRTPASTGNRRLWTWSGWVKRSGLGASTMYLFGASNTYFRFESDTFFANLRTDGGATNYFVDFVNVFRDPSAWYHFVVAVDTAQATASNRYKVYVNNVQLTTNGSYSSYPPQNSDLNVNSSSYSHEIGRAPGVSSNYLDGYLTEIHFIDGQALTPSSFGETDTITGVWKPKKYAGTYGTNGFYLKFADNSGTTSTTLGKDSSGNGNNWTPNNFSVTAGSGNDSLIDTPTPYADGGNGRGNYCTWNPLAVTAANSTLSNGNLTVVTPNVGGNAYATFAIPNSGKWYFEATPTSGSGNAYIGVSAYTIASTYLWQNSNHVFYNGAGQKSVDGTHSAYGASYTDNDVIGVACDADAGTITFYKNNSSQGSISHTMLNMIPAVTDGASASGVTYETNFGQRSFSYTPPSGFLALNTQNLPEPSIKKPSSYFDAKLYTGNGSTQTISGFGFSPDLVWLKGRSTAYNHFLADSVRGISNELVSNDISTEATYSNKLTALNSDGFSLGSTSTGATINNNGTTYVAWCWDESATPGFDIVTYTGNSTNRTIAHSLGVTPSFIIVKNRTGTGKPWRCWFTGFTGDQFITLNETSAIETLSTMWGSATPTSTTFAVGTRDETNNAPWTYVAYLWSEVAGFSKFGSYTGNGSTDGPFVHLGFRPRYLLVKRSDSANDWLVFDSARDQYNETDDLLYPNLSNAEASNSATDFDFLSNGFKLRASNANQNASGGTYIYAAFAETPFRYSLAR